MKYTSQVLQRYCLQHAISEIKLKIRAGPFVKYTTHHLYGTTVHCMSFAIWSPSHSWFAQGLLYSAGESYDVDQPVHGEILIVLV